MPFSLYMPCSKSLPHSNLIHMSKTLHFVFPYYTIFPTEKQESIPQKTTGEPLKLSCYPFYSLKQICHTVHDVTHMVKRSVTIQIHGDLHLTMSQNIAEGFHIYPTFNGTGGKCMTQSVEVHMIDTGNLEQVVQHITHMARFYTSAHR